LNQAECFTDVVTFSVIPTGVFNPLYCKALSSWKFY